MATLSPATAGAVEDTTPPTIGSGGGPEDGVWTFGYEGEDEDVAVWSFSLDGAPETVFAGDDARHATVRLPGLEAGPHTLTVWAADAAGNRAEVVWPFTVQADGTSIGLLPAAPVQVDRCGTSNDTWTYPEVLPAGLHAVVAPGEAEGSLDVTYVVEEGYLLDPAAADAAYAEVASYVGTDLAGVHFSAVFDADELCVFSAPTPVVSGSAIVGRTLTATAGTWTPAAELSYQWLRAGAQIAEATGATYVVRPADLGVALSVSVTGRAPEHADRTVASEPTVAVKAGSFVAGTPTISGAVRVGSKVTAVPGVWQPGATFTYQWKSNGVAVAGATAATWTIPSAQLGAKVSVTVTGSAPGYTTKSLTSASAVVSAGIFTASPVPTVTGTTVVGSTLTATPGTWSPSATLTYVWRRDGAPISGATKATYVLTAADHGKKMSVTVRGTRINYTTVARTSVVTDPIRARFIASPAPVITGKVLVGSKLTAAVSGWSPAPTSYTYQWYRNGAVISGATASTYVLQGADYGKTMTVSVTAARSTYLTTKKTSAATVAVGKPLPTLTKDGMYRVGVDIPAGTYMSPGQSDFCYSERSTAGGDIIWNDLGGGQRIMTILATDAFFTTQGCGTWTRLVALGSPRATLPDEGVFAVGTQVQPGTYVASGAQPDGYCYWGRLSGFRGFDDIIDNFGSFEGGQVYLTIQPTDVGVEVSGCGTWTKVG